MLKDNEHVIKRLSGVGGVSYLIGEDEEMTPKNVIKMMKYHDVSMKHEYNIIQELHDKLPILPHLIHDFKYIPSITVHPHFKRMDNPFNETHDDFIEKDALMMEYVSHVAINEHMTLDEHVSILKQLLIVLCCGQELLGFTHYDLHLDNVLVSTETFTKKDIAIFVLDDSNQFIVETHGMCPVMIDFEYSHVNNVDTQCASYDHTQYGLTPWRSDRFVDSRRLLYEYIEYLPKDVEYFVQHMFLNLCDSETGWLELENDDSIHDTICRWIYEKTDKIHYESFFIRFMNHCLHSLQSVQPIKTDDTPTKIIRQSLEWCGSLNPPNDYRALYQFHKTCTSDTPPQVLQHLAWVVQQERSKYTQQIEKEIDELVVEYPLQHVAQVFAAIEYRFKSYIKPTPSHNLIFFHIPDKKVYRMNLTHKQCRRFRNVHESELGGQLYQLLKNRL